MSFFFEREKSGESAVLVHIDFQQANFHEDLSEFTELVTSAGAKPVATLTGSRKVPEAKYFIGQGKAEELQACVHAEQAEIVLFNHALSPAQERNLERLCQCRVLDRTGLILDIFAQRARTHEGKLQVELAQLQHLSTRLVRGWTHLERQKGGIGLRGPGEKQLETDRRLLRDRIRHIRNRLAKVSKQREQGRRARRRAAIPTISLVGYTNAGKSTLFNQLTDATVLAADQLFATLDPTLRRIHLDKLGDVILADTVGFIRHLPHDLVAAFQATLEEVAQADLLIHVVDAHNPQFRDNIEQVTTVLANIGAEDVPQLKVFNKIDLLEGQHPRVEYCMDDKPQAVWLSAEKKLGFDELRLAIVQNLAEETIIDDIKLLPQQGKLRAELYRRNAVLAEDYDENGNYLLTVRLSKHDFDRILGRRE